MKILFISSSFPPETDMQTTRNIYLIWALFSRGNEVDVITCGNYRRDSSSFDTVLDRVNVMRTEYPQIYKWHKKAQKIFKNFPFLLKLHNVVINIYAKPDLYVKWDRYVINYIRENNLFDYDVVITSSGSYTAHSVGKEWKNITGKKWIAEYGDPWGLDAYGNVKKEYYKKESNLMSTCDGFVFTTRATVDAYIKNYNFKKPICLIPCGYEHILDDITQTNERKHLKFVYTGVAYKSSRNLEIFLKAVSMQSGVTAQIVGSYSNDLKKKFSRADNIIFMGRVSYKESLEIIQQADVLVHIGNLGTMQIPGKTYIYLSSKKPILYIQQQEYLDPTLEVLSKFQGIVVVNNKKIEINTAINKILADYTLIKKDAENRVKSNILDKYSWDNLGRDFADFVDKCVKG